MNRKTFYYHFQAIYDLPVRMFEQEALDVVKNFDLIADYDVAMNFIMDYIEENGQILNCAYNSIGRNALNMFYNRDFEGITNSMPDSAEEKIGRTLSHSYREFLCRFYTEGLTGMMIECSPGEDR